MADTHQKIAIIPFQNRGVTTRSEPKSLAPGSFQYMQNMTSEQEGSITSRRGRKVLGVMPLAATVPHTAYRLGVGVAETPGVPAGNPRYVGAGPDIYRTLDYINFTLVNPVPVCTTPSDAAVSKFWSLAEYDAGSSGNPWAYIAGELAMLKDNGAAPITPLSKWGIMQAMGIPRIADDGAGNLDGGDADSPSGSVPYKYLYTYRDPRTSNEGNPTIEMFDDSAVPDGVPLAVHLRKIQVTIWVDNPYGHGGLDVAVYRTGGILADGIYRFVGYTALGTLVDNVPDTELAFQTKIVEIDNGPPVASTLKTPYVANTTNSPAAGESPVNVSQALPNIYPGSIVRFSGGEHQETAVIYGTPGTALSGSSFTVYLQYDHVAGEQVEIDTNVGQPCSIALSAFDSVFLAGDPNNPQVLYKSKTGFPDSFPITTAGGNSLAVNVGSPSNPIVALAEFRGNVASLNSKNIFEVPIFQGVMYAPVATPAQRGLAATKAWCMVDNEIWYLAYDGIWSWSGGESVKRSESIDGIFHGLATVFATGRTLFPIKMDPRALQFCRMEYARRQVRFWYPTSTPFGSNPPQMEELVYDMTFERWLPGSKVILPQNYEPSNLYLERETGNLIFMRQGPNGGCVCLDDALDGAGYTSDEFTTDATTQGDPIPFDAITGWLDLGNEFMAKVFDEIWLDIDHQGGGTATDLRVNVYYDYSNTAGDTFLIPATTPGRVLYPLTLNAQNDAGDISSYGRQASVIAFEFVEIAPGGALGHRPLLYGVKFHYHEVGEHTAGPYIDWTDGGHKFDKRFYELTVEFDTNLYANGAPTSSPHWTMVLDTLTGTLGHTINEGVQEFDLYSLPTVRLSPGRAKTTFAIRDNVIAKMVRLRVLKNTEAPSPQTYFRILDTSWQFERYPPDIVPFCEWEDGGYSYLKYANQVSFDVDTGGQPIVVQIQTDGTTVVQTLTITTAADNRNVNLTLLPNLSGRKWRWFVDTSPTGPNAVAFAGPGKFQVFSHAFRWQPADKGEVGHSFDWDDLGHPYDKLLSTVTVEWDTAESGNVTLQLDIKNGIGGGTLVSNVAQYVLTGGRSKRTFAVPTDIIAKLIRIYPIGTPLTSFKQWKYSFEKTDYPADSVTSTAYKDFASQNNKNASVLWVDMDTENIAALVNVQNELGTVFSFSHTGTLHNRKRSYPFPVDKFGKMWRLLITPGSGGKSQLFDWGMEAQVDPADTVLFTPWNDFGWPFDKLARNLIITANSGGVAASVILQTGELGNVQTFSVTTDYVNREVVLPVNPGIVGKLWRLVITPGVGGQWQMWNWNLDAIREPPSVAAWSSFEQTFGYAPWKLMKQIWLEYVCASTVTLTITSDTGVFSYTFPAHATRLTERLLLPSVFGVGLNKSKTYKFAFASVNPLQPFKIYSQGSGVEWLPMGRDRHAGYSQTPLSEFMTFGEGGG